MRAGAAQSAKPPAVAWSFRGEMRGAMVLHQQQRQAPDAVQTAGVDRDRRASTLLRAPFGREGGLRDSRASTRGRATAARHRSLFTAWGRGLVTDKQRPSVVSLNGICSSCSRMEPLFRNPLGPLALCYECLRDREPLASESQCMCPQWVIRGDCPTHGFPIPR